MFSRHTLSRQQDIFPNEHFTEHHDIFPDTDNIYPDRHFPDMIFTLKKRFITDYSPIIIKDKTNGENFF
jgi:hypothetical protein